MIVNDSILYTRVIEGGRLVKQDTFLGAVLKVAIGIPVGLAFCWVIIQVCAVVGR